MTALLAARDVHRRFTRGGLLGRTQLRAVDGVDLEVGEGEVLALVGESGCGKTTLGRLLLGLDRPDEGAVELGGQEARDSSTARPSGDRLQPIFQDPYASLDPRWSVARTVREALDAQRAGTPHRSAGRGVDELLLGGGVRAAARRLPAPRALGRPASARRDRGRACGRARRARRGRAGLGARPARAGADPQPAGRPAAGPAPRDRPDHPRSHGRRAHRGSRGRDVPRPHRRDGTGRRGHAGLRHIPTRGRCSPPHPAFAWSARTAPPLRGESPSPLDPPPGCHFNPRCPLAVERCLRESPVLAPTGDGQLAGCFVTAPAVLERKEPG